MTDKGDTKDSVTIASQVFALMAGHAVSHPTSPVHGILIGSRKGDEVTMVDAYPVCHENPTKPLVENALSLVQSTLEGKKDGNGIIGWFTAPELLHETKPGPVALRIVANLAAVMGGDGQGEPILLVVDNNSLVELLTRVADSKEENNVTVSSTIKAFGKDFGMQWMEPIKNLSILDESKAKQTVLSMVSGESEIYIVKDLVDHWQQGAKSEWTSASTLASFSDR